MARLNDHLIITSYVIIDDTMRSLQHRSHRLAKVSDAEVLTVAVVAAKYFHNNHERALWMLTHLGYLSEPLSHFALQSSLARRGRLVTADLGNARRTVYFWHALHR